MTAFRRLLTFIVLVIAVPAVAQDARTERVRFDAGAEVATFHDTIIGEETVSYQVEGTADQLMVVLLNPSNASTYFNIYAPGSGPGDEALYAGAVDGTAYQGTLAVSGDYTVEVFLMRNAARRGDRTDYRLDIGLSGGAEEEQTASTDFADGLAGGPDFWEVDVSGTLNIRSEPSTDASIIVAVPGGTVLRNLGCQEAGGRTWCEVAEPDAGGVRGWTAGDFLVESAYVETEQTDALVAGTSYNATGTILCAPSRDAPSADCEFGVIRTGNGSGTVDVQLPGGGVRTITFDNGEAVSSDADADLSFGRNGDTMIINIGEEHYEMPDAVIFGG
ncbi:MAG: SH3 domain-containing protein [Pseudomonadota bacterium]